MAVTTLEIVLRAVPARDIRQKSGGTSSGDIHHVIRVEHQCQRLECAYFKCVLVDVPQCFSYTNMPTHHMYSYP